MRKLALAALLCCILPYTLIAQSIIRGTVVDTSGKPLSSATLSLVKAKDTGTVKFSLSDKSGKYEFTHIKSGHYLIVASSVGFAKNYSSAITIEENQNITVPAITMRNNSNTLSNVKVAVSRPFLEMQLDKMVVNVEASPTNAGANVLEVLAKSPGVTVDANDNISLSGKQGVLVMIDGKRTYLGGTDLANLLKGMAASNVNQIEIITNPSSRYEAEGSAGIINIKTRKNQNAGFNGSITAGASVGIFKTQGITYLKPRVQSSFTFNYRKNKVNFYGTLSPNLRKGMNSTITHKTYYTPAGGVNGYTEYLLNIKRDFIDRYFNLGLDWTLNKKNTVGVALNGFILSGIVSNNTFTDLYDENKQLIGYFVTNNRMSMSKS